MLTKTAMTVVAFMLVAMAAMADDNCGASRRFQSPVPYDSGGPLFRSSSKPHVYSGTYDDIRSIDFRNLTLRLSGSSVRLKNGRYKHRDSVGSDEARLEKVIFLTSGDSVAPQYALLELWEVVAGGSATSLGIVQLLELSNHKLRLVHEFVSDDDFGSGPGHSFDAATNTLNISSSHYLPGDSHCCISAYDLYRFKWNGHCFVQTSLSTHLSQHGQDEGKSLKP